MSNGERANLHGSGDGSGRGNRIVGVLLAVMFCANFGGMAMLVGFWPLMLLMLISLVSGYGFYRGRKDAERPAKPGSSDTG